VAERAQSFEGRTVGNFRVTRLLGAGGMGTVFLLEHITLPNTFAAIKVLTSNRGDGSLLRERFVQEALVAAALGGDRVVRPLDIGRFEDGTQYIVMEYVDGRTLADVIDRDGPLSITSALTIAHRVADAMTLAHARGIIHRDLKPSNLMLVDNQEAQVKILDFGVARAIGDIKVAHTRESVVIGSPGYMSPEAATGSPVDAKTDVFSLGVTLFKMLTGQLPFAGNPQHG
jgi:serine/threonine-protein kinase